MNNSNRQANRRKTTNLIKKYLKTKYGIKVSVQSESYSGGSSLMISYDFGPAPDIIDSELGRLQYGKFDGMQDLYEIKDIADRGMVLEGYQLMEYSYVTINRKIPDSFAYKVAMFFSGSGKFSYADIHPCRNEDDVTRNFEAPFMGVWNWKQLVDCYIDEMSFCVQDENQIELVCVENEGVVTYQVNGRIYTTDNFELPEKTPRLGNINKVALDDVQVIDYSDKAIAVIGNTYEIKDQLRALKGKFNRNLTVDNERVPGWIFSKSKKDQVTGLLS